MIQFDRPSETRASLPPFVPRNLSPAETLDHEPLEFLSGAADWPSIDEIFAARSLAMLASRGIQTWLGAGGRMLPDGRLSFAAVSSPGLAILAELWDSPGGFRWLDDRGASWLVIPIRANADDSDRPAIAITGPGPAQMLDPLVRRREIRFTTTRTASLSRIGRAWTSAERTGYAHCAWALRRLQLVDLAAHVLAALHDQRGSIEFSLAGVERSMLSAATGVRCPPASDVWDAIRSAMELQIAELRLGRLGWEPRIVRQSAAVTYAVRLSPEAFRLRISALWCRAVEAFSETVP